MGAGGGRKANRQAAQTFPEAPDPFFPCDGLVGLDSALVSRAAASPGLSLEADFHHICRLGHSHSQGTCGATRQEAAPDACICGYRGGGREVSDQQACVHVHHAPGRGSRPLLLCEVLAGL